MKTFGAFVAEGDVIDKKKLFQQKRNEAEEKRMQDRQDSEETDKNSKLTDNHFGKKDPRIQFDKLSLFKKNDT